MISDDNLIENFNLNWNYNEKLLFYLVNVLLWKRYRAKFNLKKWRDNVVCRDNVWRNNVLPVVLEY